MKEPFIFVACKIGFENACKSEVLSQFPNFRFSFSRPGFLTFKIVEGAPDFSRVNGLTFARTAGVNLGKFNLEAGSLTEADSAQLAKVISLQKIQNLHLWNRNLGLSDDDVLLEFMAQQPAAAPVFVAPLIAQSKLKFNRRAPINDHVLDLIQVGPSEYWFGYHTVTAPHQCWPGGLIRFPKPENMVSRAYLKTKEAMIWSRFPFQSNELCIEIGCAPGGSSVALLESGLKVLGIDPAEMDETVSSSPDFTHLQKRGADVQKKLLAEGKWLLVDSNVAPQYTLDMVEDIATNQHVHLNGMLLTLKMIQPNLIEEIDSYRNRVLQMGFQYVRTRQLAFNRNEVCLAALQRKSILRFGRQSAKRGQSAKKAQTATSKKPDAEHN